MVGGFHLYPAPAEINQQLLKNFLLVALGGGMGSMLRYGASLLFRNHAFFFSTLVVNITGCFLIGLLLGIAERNSTFDSHWKILLTTGFCGGFTTFSAYSWEGLQLISQQRYLVFFLYIAGTVLAGLAAVLAGWWLSR